MIRVSKYLQNLLTQQMFLGEIDTGFFEGENNFVETIHVFLLIILIHSVNYLKFKFKTRV